jgi:hypothetical protein
MASLFSPPFSRQSASLRPGLQTSASHSKLNLGVHPLFKGNSTSSPISLDLVRIRSLSEEIARVFPFRRGRAEPSTGRVGLFLGGFEDLVSFRSHVYFSL